MQIFDELKAQGVQEIGFISMDGVTGLEEGAKAVWKRCFAYVEQLLTIRRRGAKLCTQPIREKWLICVDRATWQYVKHFRVV